MVDLSSGDEGVAATLVVAENDGGICAAEFSGSDMVKRGVTSSKKLCGLNT